MIQLEDKLYTSTEVADILGVSLRSVYRYLEENKLDAEVKTATGRHRFSKKNILDFLYPNGEVPSQPAYNQVPQATEVKKKTVRKEVAPIIEEEEPVVEPVKPNVAPSAKTKVIEPEEEPVDWLAKFREAARKYREESEASEKKEEAQPMTMAEPEERISAFTQDPVPAKKVPQMAHKNFYRSNLGGLKDIAQNIDRGSRNSYLDYAFTMNAGLSLYKPIKPFSVLHAYVKPGDLSFFEKLLGLTPSDESNAQLCLLLSDDSSIYSTREELHGLYVVSKERLLADVQSMGDSALTAEASNIIK